MNESSRAPVHRCSLRRSGYGNDRDIAGQIVREKAWSPCAHGPHFTDFGTFVYRWHEAESGLTIWSGRVHPLQNSVEMRQGRLLCERRHMNAASLDRNALQATRSNARECSKGCLQAARNDVWYRAVRVMAVRVGFEPTEPVKVQRFSRPPDSTTLAPHRIGRELPDCSRRSAFFCSSQRILSRYTVSRLSTTSKPHFDASFTSETASCSDP